MPPLEFWGPQSPRDIRASPEDWCLVPTLPTAPQPAHSLTQVKEADCRAFTHRAVQGDTELLANLPDQRAALQRVALDCLVGTAGGPLRDGWMGSEAGLTLTCCPTGRAPLAAQCL